MTVDENRSQSAILHWDSYDLNQLSQDASESGISIASFFNRIGENVKISQGRSPMTLNDIENLHSPVQRCQQNQPATADPSSSFFGNEPTATEPSKRRECAVDNALNHKRRSRKFGIRNFLACWCLPIQEHEYTEISGANGVTLARNDVQHRHGPENNVAHFNLASKRTERQSATVSEFNNNVVVAHEDVGIIENKNANRDGTSDLRHAEGVYNLHQGAFGVQNHPSKDEAKYGGSFECNESCCSFHHWKEKNFSSLPKRQNTSDGVARTLPAIGNIASSRKAYQARFASENMKTAGSVFAVGSFGATESPRVFTSKFNDSTNRKAMYTLAFDCLNSQTSSTRLSESAECLGIGECSSSTCSFLRVPLEDSFSSLDRSVFSSRSYTLPVTRRIGDGGQNLKMTEPTYGLHVEINVCEDIFLCRSQANSVTSGK